MADGGGRRADLEVRIVEMTIFTWGMLAEGVGQRLSKPKIEIFSGADGRGGDLRFMIYDL